MRTSKERKEIERQNFLNEIEQLNPNDLVYIDESGVDNNIVPQYGWAQKGFRSYAEQSGFKTQRLSIIAGYAYQSKTIIAPFEFEGYTDTQVFNLWFIQELLPNLKYGQIVLLTPTRDKR